MGSFPILGQLNELQTNEFLYIDMTIYQLMQNFILLDYISDRISQYYIVAILCLSIGTDNNFSQTSLNPDLCLNYAASLDKEFSKHGGNTLVQHLT